MSKEKKVRVTFEYKDAYTHGNWSRQTCTVRSVDECIRIYGLGTDCDFRILEVLEVE